VSFNGISRNQIEELVNHGEETVASIYVPTARKGIDVLQGPIKLKQMLESVETELVNMGMRSTLAKDFVGPAQKLLSDTTFWDQRSDGVAMFLADGFFKAYHLSFPVPESIQVGTRFNILPLISALSKGEPHYVLALDKNQVRLIVCTAQSTKEATVPGMPRSLASFVSQEYAEKQSQAHSAGPAGQAGSMIRHGAGDKGADAKVKLRRYSQAIDNALRTLLHESKHPVVLAGTQEFVDEYRAVTKYPHVLPDGIIRSTKTLEPNDIRKFSQPIADQHADRKRQEELEKYRAFAGTGLTSQQPEELRDLALAGKIESLFTIQDPSGTNAEGPLPTPEWALVNEVALATLANHGSVYRISKEELETVGSAAAILRY
jgi:hypothetical protein